MSEWAEQNRVLDGKYSAAPGPIRIDYTPYVREILDAFTDRMCRKMTVISSRQVAKSTTIETLIGYCIAQDPGPAQLVLPSERDAHYMLERVKAMIDASPTIAAEKTTRKHDWRKDCVQTQRMLLNIGWAGGTSTLKGRSNRYLFCDETEAWTESKEGHPMEILIPSTNSFWNHKVVQVTTPLTVDHRTHQDYLKSDRRERHVPCPHCGYYQVLRFSRETVRWPEDERDPDVIRQLGLATYHCESCQEEIEHKDKHAAQLAGVWVPDPSEDVSTLGQTYPDIQELIEDGKYVGKRTPTNHYGWRFGALNAPWIDWSRMASEFLKLKATWQLQEFKNLWEGLPWEDRQLAADEDSVMSLEKPYEVGETPEGIRYVTAGVDVQWIGGVKHVYFVIRGWAVGGDSYMLDAGRIDEDANESDLEKVADMLETSRWGEGELKVSLALVDAGDGNRSHEVYDIARRYPAVIRPSIGRATLTDNQWIITSAHEKYDGRAKLQGGTLLTKINTDLFKTKLTGQIQTASKFWIPEDASKAYRRSLISEHKIHEKGAGGSIKVVWKVKAGHSNNHWWDGEVMAAAAAQALALDRRLDSEKVQRDETAKSMATQRRQQQRRNRGEGGWVHG